MKDSRTKPFILCVFSYFVIGCMVLTANTTMKFILQQYNWSASKGGLLISVLSLGALIMGVFGNMLVEKIGRKRAMILYSSFVMVSCLLYAISPAPWTFFPLIFISGFAWGGINAVTNTVVTEMYDGKPARLNVMHASYALGAVTFPLLVGFITMSGITWRVPVGLVALLGAALTLMSCLISLPEVKAYAQKGTDEDKIPFWREKVFYLGLIFFFTYVGSETAVNSWLAMYLGQNNQFFSKIPGETMVSLMWLTMVIGRLLFAAISTKIDKKVLITMLSSGYLIGLTGVIFFSANTVLAVVFVAFMGLSMSAMYANCVANTSRYITGSAAASGILYGTGNLGSASVPFLAGQICDAAGLKSGMIALLGIIGVLVASTVVNLCGSRKEKSRG